METELKNYEISFLVKTEENQKEIIEIFKKNQIPVLNEGKMSKIKLAFPIKKENFAYFGYLYFSSEPQKVKNLSGQLKTNPEILRFLIVRQPSVKDEEGKIVKKTSLSQKKQSSENRQDQKEDFRLSEKISKTEVLSNEALEKKLEEILNNR